MSVCTEVRVVCCEDFQFLGSAWKNGLHCIFPCLVAIILVRIPCVRSHTIDRQQRRFSMFHRIGYKTRHEVGDVEVVAINRTHEQVVANIVGYREVPPYVCWTLDEVVDPFHATLFSVTFVHIGNYTVACPHDVDAWIQLSTQGSKISTFYIRPTLVIFSRTHDERSYIFLYFHELFVNVVQEFGLLVCLGTFPRNVVEEYSIRANA